MGSTPNKDVSHKFKRHEPLKTLNPTILPFQLSFLRTIAILQNTNHNPVLLGTYIGAMYRSLPPHVQMHIGHVHTGQLSPSLSLAWSPDFSSGIGAYLKSLR